MVLTTSARGPLRFRRGFYLLPSMFTIANMFCGYACIVYAMRGHYETGAAFIGIAGVLDMLDGRIARATGTTSAFGLELDSLADVISFGLAPAILAFAWGLTPLGRLGWAVGFVYVTAAALRLARFNIQSSTGDKRYFVGLPSPAAAAVPASSVFAYPVQLTEPEQSLAALAIVLVPAILMVSTVRFRGFKTVNLGWRRQYLALFAIAIALALVAAEPKLSLVIAAYTYLLSGLVGLVLSRLRRRSSAATTPEPREATE
jgi:CDP-diacylglycerol--serine O-phosphatidyltransferase